MNFPASHLAATGSAGPTRSKSVQTFHNRMAKKASRSHENLTGPGKLTLPRNTHLRMGLNPNLSPEGPGPLPESGQPHLTLQSRNGKASRSRIPVVGSSNFSSTNSLSSNNSHVSSLATNAHQQALAHQKINAASPKYVKSYHNSLGNLHQPAGIARAASGPYHAAASYHPTIPASGSHVLGSPGHPYPASNNLTAFQPRRGPTLLKRDPNSVLPLNLRPGLDQHHNCSNSNSNSSNQSHSNLQKDFLRHRDSLPSYGTDPSSQGVPAGHHFRTKSDIISENSCSGDFMYDNRMGFRATGRAPPGGGKPFFGFSISDVGPYISEIYARVAGPPGKNLRKYRKINMLFPRTEHTRQARVPKTS